MTRPTLPNLSSLARRLNSGTRVCSATGTLGMPVWALAIPLSVGLVPPKLHTLETSIFQRSMVRKVYRTAGRPLVGHLSPVALMAYSQVPTHFRRSPFLFEVPAAGQAHLSLPCQHLAWNVEIEWGGDMEWACLSRKKIF